MNYCMKVIKRLKIIIKNSIITKGKKTIRTNNLLSLAKKIKNQFKRKEQKKEIAENDISKEN